MVVRGVNGDDDEGSFQAFVFKNKSMDGSDSEEDRVCPMDDMLWELKVCSFLECVCVCMI